MMGHTPPMGWNSWNTFGVNINEQIVKEVADAMVAAGLADAGYQYVVIDDGWSLRERDENKRLVPDPEKFPSGMKALSDYVHSRGLKFGIYSCAGVKTCAGYPGSFEHEFIDAETFAEWGVDFLKYDYCYKPRDMDGRLLYRRMAMALKNCGREILFSACNWGIDDSHLWMRSAGAHMWRSTYDILDSWESIKKLAMQQLGKECYSGPYSYNDVDMLVVGMYNKGNVALGGCTDEEYKTHFSLWCMMNSPLMIGCDVRKMKKVTRSILTNKELIAVNQDLEVRQAYTITGWHSKEVIHYIKPLVGGDYAICSVNFGDARGWSHLEFWDLGLPTAAGYGFELHDLWTGENLGVKTESYMTALEPHCCKVFRAKLKKVN